MEVTVEQLRQELLDYCGTASFAGMPAAMGDVTEIESASPSELLAIAQRLGIRL